MEYISGNYKYSLSRDREIAFTEQREIKFILLGLSGYSYGEECIRYDHSKEISLKTKQNEHDAFTSPRDVIFPSNI